MRNLEEFFPNLKQPFKAVVTMHQKPDGDALGASLALGHLLGKLGHEVTVISPTNWPEFLNWIPGCSKVFDFESKKGASIEKIEAADYVFCLDFNALNRAKGLEPVLRSTKAEILLIDHHQEPERHLFIMDGAIPKRVQQPKWCMILLWAVETMRSLIRIWPFAFTPE